MAEQTVGQMVDHLGGCTIDLEDGDLVVGVALVVKVLHSDDTVSLATTWSEGTSWVERVGMFRVAEQMELPTDDDRRG